MVMSQIAMELDEQATELGFESLQEALDAGCTVEYGPAGQSELVEPLVAAHRAWEKEKQEILNVINNPEWMAENMEYGDVIDFLLTRVVPFIEEAHD